MATYPVPLAGTRLNTAFVTSMLPLVAYKTADETVNTSATLQNDNDLFLSIVPGTYALKGHFNYITGDTPDIKFGWTWPTFTVMTWTAHGPGTAVTTTTGDVTVSMLTESQTAVLGGGGGGNMACVVTGTVYCTTAGTLQLQWAQNTSTASNTSVLNRSWLELKRYV